MDTPEFHTIISLMWLAVAVMNLISLLLDDKKAWRSLDRWLMVVMPLLLFGAYQEIASLLST
jgi:hypothetical protein